MRVLTDSSGNYLDLSIPFHLGRFQTYCNQRRANSTRACSYLGTVSLCPMPGLIMAWSERRGPAHCDACVWIMKVFEGIIAGGGWSIVCGHAFVRIGWIKDMRRPAAREMTPF